MKHITKARIIAGFIIFLLFILYVLIKDAMGLKHGGSAVLFALFSCLVYYVWDAASDMGEAKDLKEDISPSGEDNPPIPDEELTAQQSTLNRDRSEETLPSIPSVETEESQISSTANQEDVQLEKPNEGESSTIDVPIPEETPMQESKEDIANKSSFQVHLSKYKWYYSVVIVLALVTGLGIKFIHNKEAQKKQFIVAVDNGYRALENSYYDLALRYFTEALEIDSTNAGLFYKIGESYAGKRDFTEAAKNYKRAYVLNDDESDMVVSTNDTITYDALLRDYFIALFQSSLDKSDLLLLAQDYISRCPNDVMAYKNIAVAYWSKKDNYKAMEWANKMIEVFPDEFESYFTLAVFQYQMNGDYENAIKNFEIAISIEEDNGLAYNNMGECYMLKHQYEKAYDCWRKAVALGENRAYDNLKKCGQIN